MHIFSTGCCKNSPNFSWFIEKLLILETVVVNIHRKCCENKLKNSASFLFQTSSSCSSYIFLSQEIPFLGKIHKGILVSASGNARTSPTHLILLLLLLLFQAELCANQLLVHNCLIHEAERRIVIPLVFVTGPPSSGGCGGRRQGLAGIQPGFCVRDMRQLAGLKKKNYLWWRTIWSQGRSGSSIFPPLQSF